MDVFLQEEILSFLLMLMALLILTHLKKFLMVARRTLEMVYLALLAPDMRKALMQIVQLFVDSFLGE